MKDFGNSFSRGIRIRAAGFVLFCSRAFLRSSGGLGVQAASGAGWERAARFHGGVANTTLRSFRSVPALEWSHFDLAFLVHLDLELVGQIPTELDLCPHAYGIQKPYYGTMQCHYTNSCKCSEFRINGLQLHFTNFRMSCIIIDPAELCRHFGQDRQELVRSYWHQEERDDP